MNGGVVSNYSMAYAICPRDETIWKLLNINNAGQLLLSVETSNATAFQKDDYY